MGDTISTVHIRRKEDSKLNKQMATHKLEQTRGFTIKPDSTFHQNNGKKTMQKTGMMSYFVDLALESSIF